MAASVRIEDEAFGDRRYDRLAAECGLADADHARGKMAVLWRQCTLEQRHVLPVEDVLAVLGPSGENALVLSRLGDKHPRGIRIRGTKGRIEWLKKLRENGAKGGRPRKPKGLASGSPELNPPAPAPAPAQKTKTEDPPNPPFASEAFAKAWAEWEEHRRQRGPKLTPAAVAKQFAKLARMGEARAIAAIEHSIASSYQGIYEPNQNGRAGRHADRGAEFLRMGADAGASDAE